MLRTGVVLALTAILPAIPVRGDDAAGGPTRDDGKRLLLKSSDLAAGPHHTRHAEIHGKHVTGYNRFVLQGVDAVQEHAKGGGEYFIGVKATPPESPIGYSLTLFGKPLLDPPRTSSYCSGASYAAFIEAMGRIFPAGASRISPERLEALRMQEPDGARREDGVKFWGHWNADGFGCQFALVQYSGMGEEVAPERARPGDFMNISWTNGIGHSVVFLGWNEDPKEGKRMAFWSSQKGTNGLGDAVVPLSRVKAVKIVRLTNPERVFAFDPAAKVGKKVPGDDPGW